MVPHTRTLLHSPLWRQAARPGGWWLWGLLLLLLMLPGGLHVGWRPGPGHGPQCAQPTVERQALANLLALYQEAVVAEDSDRLQALLAPATALAPAQTHCRPAPGPGGGL